MSDEALSSASISQCRMLMKLNTANVPIRPFQGYEFSEHTQCERTIHDSETS